ncbi:30S ribosomal protein S3 [Acetobacterium carbinolicum]|jgi:small subunit ribosomal protein S3|uniref:Small ribosomal subunit protein uS3 n=1 Tax=Acetobacterium wieringae TaxID=52694 RepID=A0A1F2PKD2_9FIRM|nr:MULTISPECIES: 30S ribosomal protein S3 [Acetobacterium]MDP2843884.1 30S ribosomal protein S3 [Acetobacterium sp.]MDZ5725393.1 30S ribosomal protein S3 [Acetobacterium sp. K1/6]MEA4806631.1 30S ribosomal protein S3 [Acetobacterium wieringae]OFV71823.1 30S ribosomal protein S3 [Acetobacterium wieringae]OXS24726.1 MAG: 30S ribosomal protein S3 [Acetobacterium sp. MES1]
MGQKVNPHGLRVGVIKDWNAKWFANNKDFADCLIEDYDIRKYIKVNQYQAGISKIVIERFGNKVKIHIYTAKPGMIIGRGGAGIDALRLELEKMTKKTVFINIVEVKNVDMDAQLVAENIAAQLERRISFRRAMKQTMQRTMRAGAKGIKTAVAGRLNGAEMARNEHYAQGQVPLQTLRADISYGFAEADTTYGKLGVKVWVNKGEILTGREDILAVTAEDDAKAKKSAPRRKAPTNRTEN